MQTIIVYFSVGFIAGVAVGYLINKKESLEEKENKDREKDLSQAIFHELRAYLTNLTWIFDKLYESGLCSVNDEQYKIIVLGKNSVKNANNLVSDTLEAFSVGRAAPKFKFNLNDITKVLEEILGEYQLIANERKIELAFEKSQVPIPLFYFDRSQMYLALHDLVYNAMKYSHDGGKIQVKTEMIDGKMRLTITDHGIGIPASQLNNIFTKFFRADNAKKILAEGTGLGMYIARNIITRHKGDIKLQSEENKGTTVDITLPLLQTEPV